MNKQKRRANSNQPLSFLFNFSSPAAAAAERVVCEWRSRGEKLSSSTYLGECKFKYFHLHAASLFWDLSGKTRGFMIVK
jgi:hypothetical protein